MKNITSDNRFLKVLIAALRAKQIHKGARPLVQTSNTRATRIALEEVERGLISFEFMPQMVPRVTQSPQAPQSPQIPQVLDLRSAQDNRDDSRRGDAAEINRGSDSQLLVASLGD